MNSKPTAREREHLARIKALPCVVCDAPGPSEAHHVDQGDAFSCIALCSDCHRGPRNGWHGQRAMWRLKKLDELRALALTVRALMEAA